MGTATYSGPADPPACRFGRGPERIAMRTLFVLLAIILLTQPAAARGKRDRGDEPKDDAQKNPGPERQSRSLGQGALSSHRRPKAGRKRWRLRSP
jgi:hypothetical protein